MEASRDLPPQFRASSSMGELDGSRRKFRHGAAGNNFRSPLAKESRQLASKSGLDFCRLRSREGQSFQNQPFDVEMKVHASACCPFVVCGAGSAGGFQRKSASLIGRPSFMNSARAASRMNCMVTLEFSCAAMKAAFNATV